MSQLDRLREMTVIVADTGEIDEIKKYKPTDATTNPSLILKASGIDEYQSLITEAVAYGKERVPGDPLHAIITKIFVNFGTEILKIIPGRVSTEVDARLSFDVKGSIAKAREYVRLYEEVGIDRERILIKLASTWEGVVAAKELQKEGISCNMTLMFGLVQAVACADAGATLVSPFVGRILDWYKKAENREGYPPREDPGVLSVTEIFNYYKKFDYPTQIMGASFRNAGEITELAGCDLLTISPSLLKELSETEGEVPEKLSVSAAKKGKTEKITVDEKRFRYMLNENAMATEKLAEGIRNFAKDTVKLEKVIEARL
ncbi:MAG: transaldolase [Simkaniaceae bacterium]|nr:transaldolase [Simkaniaceae bacterium]